MLVIQGGISFSQENLLNNLNVINKLIDESFIPLNNKFLLLGKDRFYEIDLNGKEDEHLYLMETIKKKFNGLKLIINEDSDSSDYRLIFKNPSIKTKYVKIFTDDLIGTKKVEREVLVSYELDLIEKKSSSIIYHQKFNKKHKDNFGLDKLSLIEDRRYLFSQSNLPEESFLNQLLYPSIIIIASAVAIILFFTIRSN